MSLDICEKRLLTLLAPVLWNLPLKDHFKNVWSLVVCWNDRSRWCLIKIWLFLGIGFRITCSLHPQFSLPGNWNVFADDRCCIICMMHIHACMLMAMGGRARNMTQKHASSIGNSKESKVRGDSPLWFLGFSIPSSSTPNPKSPKVLNPRVV